MVNNKKIKLELIIEVGPDNGETEVNIEQVVSEFKSKSIEIQTDSANWYVDDYELKSLRS